MIPVNANNTKKCALCRYWYDPANTAIRPRNVKNNIWEIDPDVKKMCMKKKYERPGSAFCGEYECKV